MALRLAPLQRWVLPPKKIIDRDVLTMSIAEIAGKHGLDE
jgi:hypothetical protein